MYNPRLINHDNGKSPLNGRFLIEQFIIYNLQMFHHRRRKKAPQIPSCSAEGAQEDDEGHQVKREAAAQGPGPRTRTPNEGRPKGRSDVRRERSQLPTNFAGASRHRPKPRHCSYELLQIVMN